MIKQTLKRVILLSIGFVVSSLLIYGQYFGGLAGSWAWKKEYQPSHSAISMKDHKLSSYHDGVLISGLSYIHQRRLSRVNANDNTNDHASHLDQTTKTPPILLNDLLPKSQKKAIGLDKERDSLPDEFREHLEYITFLFVERNEHLYLSARLIGSVRLQNCNDQGHCILVTSINHQQNDIAFYSDDGGAHWRWLDNWPSDYITELFIVDADFLIIEMSGTLYSSNDLGQHWQVIASIKDLLLQNGIGFGSDPSEFSYHWNVILPSIFWLPDSKGNITIWGKLNENETDNKCSLVMIIDSRTKAVINAIRFDGLVNEAVNSPEKDIYFILSQPRRYSLNQLHTDGSFTTILHNGSSSLNQVWAGRDSLIAYDNYSTPKKMRVSRDHGENWSQMKGFDGNLSVFFDGWRNRFFRFPSTYGDINKLGNTDSLVYEMVVLD